MYEYNYNGMEVTLPNNKRAGRCRNAITKELDRMSGLPIDPIFNHYILNDNWSMEEHVLAVRVPGGTVGEIKYDDDLIITSISIDTNYVVKTYFRNVNKNIRKSFVGKKLEFKEED